jgi:hypothetical protein
MDNQDEISYGAVITLTLPGENKPINLTLTLSPSSPVKVSEGQVKALRDCTLAELQQFAEKMEADIWARHEQSSLAELLEDGQTRLDVQLIDEQAEETEDSKNWMEFTVSLPEKNKSAESTTELNETPAEQETDDLDNADSEEGTAPELEPELEEVVEAETAEAPVDESAEEVPEETDTAEPVDDDPEPNVTVSEAELVYEEREAPTGTMPPVTTGAIRILGKRRPLDHPTWTAGDILINEPAFRDAQAHSLSSLNREVAGFLIGPQPEKQPDGRYLVHISDVIIAKHTRSEERHDGVHDARAR